MEAGRGARTEGEEPAGVWEEVAPLGGSALPAAEGERCGSLCWGSTG